VGVLRRAIGRNGSACAGLRSALLRSTAAGVLKYAACPRMRSKSCAPETVGLGDD
jgi:hypothetical protein